MWHKSGGLVIPIYYKIKLMDTYICTYMWPFVKKLCESMLKQYMYVHTYASKWINHLLLTNMKI
jgi:hypothetical protein